MYVKAPNGEQRYKEGEYRYLRNQSSLEIKTDYNETSAGRYILEAAKIVKENNW